MSGTTPNLHYPYPDPTDPLANGADDIKALALAVDGNIPYLVQSWQAIYTASAGGIITVAYPKPFRAGYIPRVFITNGDHQSSWTGAAIYTAGTGNTTLEWVPYSLAGVTMPNITVRANILAIGEAP